VPTLERARGEDGIGAAILNRFSIVLIPKK
jgi:hypothetical protein